MSRATYERSRAEQRREAIARQRADEMLKALVAELNKLGVGEYAFKSISDNQGFDIDIKVRITRRPENWEQRKAWIDTAIEYLGSLDYWPNSGSCHKPTSKKSSFSSSAHWCSNAFTHAVVTNKWYDRTPGTLRFDFVCYAHGDKAAVDKTVLAVIELPKLRVLDAKKIVDARVAERGRQLCAIRECGHTRSKHHMIDCDECRELRRKGFSSTTAPEHTFVEKKK